MAEPSSYPPKTAGESPVFAAIELKPQRHGGALLPGGKKGNKGGGRPSDKLRKALQAVGKAGIAKVLKPIIEGQPVKVLARQRDAHGEYVDEVVEVDPEPGVRVKAVDIALKYGLGSGDADVVVNDNRKYAELVVFLPKLGSEISELPEFSVEVHQLPAEIPEP